MWKGVPCPKIYPGETFNDGITNGANWYIVHGGMQDWNYLNSNCLELTLELGCVKFPKHDKLPQYWDDNKNALIKFMEQARINTICTNETTKSSSSISLVILIICTRFILECMASSQMKTIISLEEQRSKWTL
jgi:hypothetical protein